MSGLAGEEQREEVIELWQKCFGDDREYISRFLDHYLKQNTLFAESWHGRLASMLFLLPAVWQSPSGSQPLRYIYAVGTQPELRGKGFAGRLLKDAVDCLKSAGETAVLVPAEARLFEYYKKHGFREPVYMEQRYETFGIEQEVSGLKQKGRGMVRAAELEFQKDFKVQPFTAAEYCRMRDRYFERNGYIRWGEEAVSYALQENQAAGGFCIGLFLRERVYGVFGKREKGHLIIKEITAENEEAFAVAGILAKEWGLNRISMRLRAGDNVTEKAKFALALTGSAEENRLWKQSYLNLTLD